MATGLGAGFNPPFGTFTGHDDYEMHNCASEIPEGEQGFGGRKPDWYDPKTGELYKERVEGDGLNKGKKSPGWPGADSLFKDAARKPRHAKEFPPQAKRGKLFAGGKNMCATFATVNSNLMKHAKRIAGLKHYGKDPIAAVHEKMTDCMIKCYPGVKPLPSGYAQAYKKQGRLGIGDGMIMSSAKDIVSYMLKTCKEECLYQLTGIREKIKRPKYPAGTPYTPRSPYPPDSQAPNISPEPFTCPPYGKGNVVVVAYVVTPAIFNPKNPSRPLTKKPYYHQTTGVIECCNEKPSKKNPKGCFGTMRVRTIEQSPSYETPGTPGAGGSRWATTIMEFNKKGVMISLSDRAKYNPPRSKKGWLSGATGILRMTIIK